MRPAPDLHPEWLDALHRPESYPHPVGAIERLETHISWVFLTGPWAYKLKKPVKFPFVDFTTPQSRHAACLEELRLNRRTAPELYDAVIPLHQTAGGPRWDGDGTILEYAVRMRQFPQSDLLLNRLVEKGLGEDVVAALGKAVADLHRWAAAAEPNSGFGAPGPTHQAVIDCFDAMTPSQLPPGTAARIPELRSWADAESARLHAHFDDRRRRGFIRECHGDLHLRNLVLVNGSPRLFDALEFNEKLRWIDVVSDLAFLVMDLHDHAASPAAWQVLNVWLEQIGDFEGLRALRYYLVYRAAVRAKVASLRLSQGDLPPDEMMREVRNFAGYVALADRFCTAASPAVVVMHGLSGSGKSVIAGRIAREFGGIRIRSDVERKRLLGAWPTAGASLPRADELYSASANQRTYDRLVELTEVVTASGYSAIVDAAFLSRADRERLASLARRLSARFVIVSCEAPGDVLDARVRARHAAGTDPSDATPEVLQGQRRTCEPLTAWEREHGVVCQTADERAWDAMAGRLRPLFG